MAGAGRWVLRGALALAGAVAGLGVAEAAFRARDQGAFAHLNVYESDPELGARLRPGASMRIAFGGNAVTSVRINADGLRGPELPPPSARDVLVVGDSQVFGLGVEEGETFAARLGARLPGAQVVNLGVPTYGPLEYERVLEAWVPRRKPREVVLVVNLANDLFEAERPNRERHAVWDGWAVRKETAPVRVVEFPGRGWLFRESHAAFAARRWWYRLGPQVHALSMPSEGSWGDIAGAAARAAVEHEQARQDARRLDEMMAAQADALGQQLRQAQASYRSLADSEHLGATVSGAGSVGNFPAWQQLDLLAAAFAQPGDIVGSEDYGEWSQPMVATAFAIQQGAEYRKVIEKRLREVAAQNEAKRPRIEAVLGEAQRATDAVAEARRQVPPRIRAWSPLAPSVRRVARLCEANGARLLVVALPIDVQVSADEWAKYGSAPVDLASSQILIDDLVESAEAVGVEGLDLTPALRAAEPGAFLQRDLHLSARGHEAVAGAIAAALGRRPVPPLRAPDPGLPPGRTPPTPLRQARSHPEVSVPGSTAAGCETYIVDEWLTLRCHDRGVDGACPLGVRVAASPLGESVVYRDEPGGAVVVQVPVLPGQDTIVNMRWPGRGRRLDTTWKDGRVTVAFHPLPADAAPVADLAPPPADVCRCEKEVARSEACGLLPVVDNPACFATYRGDCASALGCLRADRATPVVCPRGQAPVGAFQLCRSLCSDAYPCAQGRCSDYQGARVCL